MATEGDVQNPLMQYRKYSVKNILMAFTNTSDAINTKVDYTVGETGTVVKGQGCGGNGVVVVNEFTDFRFIVYAHENEFTFHSYFDHSTSSMTGSLTIVDLVGSYFQNFLRDDVAAKLDISETHIIFCLRTFIIGTKADETQEIISIKPLLFHMYNMTHGYNNYEDKTHNFYTLMYVADYNTFALLPNYSKMFQMTITHKESSSPGNVLASNAYLPQPTPQPTATLTVTPTVTITPTIQPPPSPTPTPSGFQPPSTFSISQAGLDLIKAFEGLSLTAYFDVNAYAIGYGHRKGVTQGMTINQAQADAFLLQDVQWAQDAVRKNVTVPLDQGKFDALCSLTYNLGAAGYKRLLATLNSGDYDTAQSQFALYCYSGGKVNQSLVNRRADEAAVFGGEPPPTGDQPAPVQLPLPSAPPKYIDVRRRDIALNNYRAERIQSNKTMMTIKDVMEGLEAALKEQNQPPTQRLSTWLSQINQNYAPPLLPNDQKKDGGVLPIDYNVRLDPVYDDYVINNRNIPFEQPEQSQTAAGIKVFQVKPGKMLTKTVNNLMKLSNQVGDDARADAKTQKSYKCNISCVKTCSNRYQFDLHIAQYIVPQNSQTVDTGPGESNVEPLVFTYQENAKDRDILDISMSMFSDSSLGILSQPENSTDNRSIYGGREQIMLERNPDVDFFKTSYSGLRGMANVKNFGLERPNGPVSIDNLVKTNLAQTSKLFIKTIGNPYLLSDLFRNPQKVVDEDADNPNFYKYPEYYPMYSKMNIYIKPSANIGIKPDADAPRQYYYTGYYHLARVKTVMTSAFFIQELEMLRTDDTT